MAGAMTGDLPARPGERIAGYVLEAQIGTGGMAVVFRARDERLGRPVALKLLAPGLAADGGFRQRFIRESRAAAAVDHPNIIPVYEAGEADGALFIAMRYVQGGDVRTLIDQNGPLPAARAWAIVSQVAGALDSAHRHGLIHRDVKPGNILLDAGPAGRNRGPGPGEQPEHVYLSDFGISKQPAGASSLTLAGQFVGTLDYIAPEQIDGRDLDGRADLYSLGCAAYELLSGKPPFRQSQGLALVHAHLSEPPPMLTAERPDLPEVINRVLASAMAKSPDDRYPTCVQFAADLGRSLGLVAGNPAPPQAQGQSRSGPAIEAAWPPQAPQAPRRRSGGARTGGITAVAAVLAAAAVVAVVLVGRGHGPGPADAGDRSAGSAGASASGARSTPSPPPPAPASAAAPALAPPPASAPAPVPAPGPDSGSVSGPAPGAQAAGVNALLSAGAGANPRLLTALGAINQCADMASSVSVLTQIRDQRSTEYGRAQAISVSLLPQGSTLKADLTQALYYSLQADDQYLNWADQQSRGPCQEGSEPALASDNDQASADKDSFTQLWNPIALQYGLTTQSVTSM
jgi:Protein kinase domain